MTLLEELFTKVYFLEIVTFCEYIKDIIYWGNDASWHTTL